MQDTNKGSYKDLKELCHDREACRAATNKSTDYFLYKIFCITNISYVLPKLIKFEELFSVDKIINYDKLSSNRNDEIYS
ncbi:LINE-1 reverse transcriptase [Aphis craccivora]|uniref:LINE-1 reverse transcriptase n=1 Tax=Aphis craccivora TaxID=307492 RepID=A0A6G0YTW3_APHCR|nr:LINE-1 reverse transcriptase [Aphis craccivora]